MLKTGPFAWNGVLSYYIPYFCWLCWYTAASIYMIKDVRRRMIRVAPIADRFPNSSTVEHKLPIQGA